MAIRGFSLRKFVVLNVMIVYHFRLMQILGKQFIFVRHAETIWNAQHLCQGTKDIALSEKGIQKSLQFAANLQGHSFPCICTSPLRRARSTAEMIFHHHPQSIFAIIDELKERHWGALEGISSDEMYAIEKKEEENPDYNPGQGVEGRKELTQRAATALNKAFNLHPAPLLISHGRFYLGLCDLLNLPRVRQIPHLTLIHVKCEDGVWSATPSKVLPT